MPIFYRYLSSCLLLFILIISACQGKQDATKATENENKQQVEIPTANERQQKIAQDASQKIDKLFATLYCNCQKETDAQKKKDCDHAIKDIFDKLINKPEAKIKTLDEFKATLAAECK